MLEEEQQRQQEEQRLLKEEQQHEAEEEEEEEEDAEGERLSEEELLVNYALTLPVTGTAAANLRPARNGEGNVPLRDDYQLDGPARMQIAVCATNSMDFNNINYTKRRRERIAEAACTLVCYDLGYRKVKGQTMVKKYLQELIVEQQKVLLIINSQKNWA